MIVGEVDPIIGERDEKRIKFLYALGGRGGRLTSFNSTKLERFLIAHMWWKAYYNGCQSMESRLCNSTRNSLYARNTTDRSYDALNAGTIHDALMRRELSRQAMVAILPLYKRAL